MSIRVRALLDAAQVVRDLGSTAISVHDASPEMLAAAEAVKGAERSQVDTAEGEAWEVVRVAGVVFHGVVRRCTAHGEICKTDGCEVAP